VADILPSSALELTDKTTTTTTTKKKPKEIMKCVSNLNLLSDPSCQGFLE